MQRAGRALAAAESTVASLTAHVGDVTAKVEQELVPRSDLLAAQVALANAYAPKSMPTDVPLPVTFDIRDGARMRRTPEEEACSF